MRLLTIRLCLFTLLVLLALIGGATTCFAHDEWPKVIALDSGAEIDVFKPEITRYDRMTVQFKSVFSIIGSDPDNRAFGMAWVTARVAVDSVHAVMKVMAYTVDMVRVPDDPDLDDRSMIWSLLRVRLQDVIKELSLSEAKEAELARTKAEEKRSGRPGDREDTALVVYWRTQPAALVEIDGSPDIVYDEHARMDEVMNSSVPMFRNDDGKYYLEFDWQWYRADTIAGPYVWINDFSDRFLKKLEKTKPWLFLGQSRGSDDRNAMRLPRPGPIRDIVISKVPALLIHTEGEPLLDKIDSTSLAYVTNTAADIFLDSLTNTYYLLMAGQWYRSHSLCESCRWTKMDPTDLPEEFARIPAAGEKRMIRQYVAGTDEAENVVSDRQVPTVFRVDRYRTTSVWYDREPAFVRIAGTKLKYAINTCSIVLYDGRDYYTLWQGVWFTANNPRGFWTVSDHRPDGVDRIPAACSVSRAKYVDVFGVSGGTVWTGYLPGYLEGPYDTCNCRFDCTIGFPFLNAMSVGRLLIAEKEGKIHYNRPSGPTRTGLFTKQY